MKKTIILITSLMLFTSCAFSSELSFNSGDSQRVKIKQTGSRVKINVIKNNNNESIYSDAVPNKIFDDSAVIQDTNGNADILRVQNGQRNYLDTNYATLQRNTGVAGALTVAAAIAYVMVADPYVVKINGQKYYMVRDKEDNKYTKDDILGYDDTKTELFDDMKSLNSDDDATKITKEELKKAGIRFVAMVDNKLQLQDKSQDYNIDNIQYIDLTTLRGTVNQGKIGSFGYFDMYIKENFRTKKIIGFVTFDSDKTLDDMVSQ